MKKAFAVLTLVPVVLLLMMIFGFSAETAEQSGDTSAEITKVVVELVVPEYEKLPEPEKTVKFETVHHFVRKGAHFSEFAALGFFLALHFTAVNSLELRLGYRPVWLWAWGIGTAFAALDEVHQLFVPGRAGQLTDTFIDSAGVITGAVVMTLVIHIYNRFKGKYDNGYKKAEHGTDRG